MILVVIDDTPDKIEVIKTYAGIFLPKDTEIISFRSWKEAASSEESLKRATRILLDHNLSYDGSDLNGDGVYKQLEDRGLSEMVYGISNSAQKYLPEERRFNDLRSFSKLFLRLREDLREGELGQNPLR